jgi:hypothetical protein
MTLWRPFVVLLVLVTIIASSPVDAITNDCSTPPAFPANPIWCFTLVPEPVTRTATPTTWVDNFTTGINLGEFNSAYVVLDAYDPALIKAQEFQHANQWMVDMQDQSTFNLSGGEMVSPNQTFPFVNGVLSVEFDAAPGQDGAGGAEVFYELDISPARALSPFAVDSLYGYGQFGGTGAMGCRLEKNTAGGQQVCARYDNSYRTAGGQDIGPGCNQPPDFIQCPVGPSGRLWETLGIGTQYTATTTTGGYPGYQIPNTILTSNDVFRQCDRTVNPPSTDADHYCRDRFRFEFRKDSLVTFVNGFEWYRITGLFASNPGPFAPGADNRIPDSWMTGGVYVYFTSWINNGQHNVNRWHWQRIAVNTPPSGASPSYCLGAPFNTCP